MSCGDNTIRIKRVYDPYDPDDGQCFLVDRLWPRGIRKEKLQMAVWLKGIAPSEALRQWFGHNPALWHEFRERYRSELEEKGDELQPVLAKARLGTITLLYAARDREHNNAVVLKEFLENHLKGGQP